MNKKAKRAYDKAMVCYEKGKINKALEICEEVLLEGLENPDVLNFKGLLLYQKGNLNDAITAWKMNKELNNDELARNYIKDAINDEKRIALYRQGEQALKQLKIDKALELFKSCAESDFNSIKVNTGISMCYQKKGDFYRSKEYVDKALSIDRNAITAKIIEKELKEDGVYSETRNSSKGFLIGITSIFVVLTIATGAYLLVFKVKNKELTNNIADTKSNEVVQEDSIVTDKNKAPEVQEKKEAKLDTTSGEIAKGDNKNTKFNKEKLKVLIQNNDLDGVYEQLKGIKEESISNEDLEVYKQAIKLMKNEGISKFYEYGLKCFNENNYSDARISFDKAYTYCEGSSIKEHVLFYRASTSLKEADKNVSLTQYEEYYKQYPKGVYTQEALYELALLTKNLDNEKSKSYANALINNFPGSIYINDNIVSIVRS